MYKAAASLECHNSASISASESGKQLPSTIENNIEKDIMVFENIDWSNIILEKILRKSSNNNTIEDVVMVNKRLACTRGQNFLSQLWKFSLHYTCCEKVGNSMKRIEKILHLILKEEPQPGFSLDYIRENDIFRVELTVFENILPIMERLVDQQIAPRFFCGSTCPPTIILEDLSPFGFENMCRQSGLPKSHMLKAIESIAHFHAASVALNEKQPGYLQHFKPRPVSEANSEGMYNFLDFIIQQIADRIRNWPEFWAFEASQKLKKLLATQRQRMLTVMEYDKREFCVLNHGDCWITNFMFRENEHGEPLEVRLLDYQMTVWSSPAVDLIYFLNTCPEVNLKVEYDDYFLQTYMDILSKTMASLRCTTKPPSMADIKQSMFKRRIYAIMAGLIFYPRMIADDSDIESLDDCLKIGTTKMDIFKNSKAVEALKKLIPSMLEKGYLE